MEWIAGHLLVALRRLRRAGSGRWFGWLYERTGRWLPGRRLWESDKLVVIEHPRPVDAFHALLIPKQAIAGLQDVQPDHADLLFEVIQIAGKLAGAYGLQHYKIVVNGGAYQEIPQLHFHMISDEEPATTK